MWNATTTLGFPMVILMEMVLDWVVGSEIGVQITGVDD
jgi:hypothetical protein